MSDTKMQSELLKPSSLNEGRKPLWKRMSVWLIVVFTLSALLLLLEEGDTETVQYRTHKVRSGNFTVTVAASGTLQPKIKVKVGCELSGMLEKIYKDYNDPVKKGEVIARLGTDELKARVTQLRAALEFARAQVLRCRAELADSDNELARMQRLRAKKAVSQKALDSAVTAKQLADAELSGAGAKVRQAYANLVEAEANLKKASITSPIDGLVLERHVEPGQAVSSGLQTPDLFTIAAGLDRMRLELNIDEADVGKIKKGQKALFTVDAYPGRNFTAVLEKLRYSPQRVQGVVTYVGTFAVENPDLVLRPGMTASAKIEISKVNDKLILPNAAFRFIPDDAGYDHYPQGTLAEAKIWVLNDGSPKSVEVVKGRTDGRYTEVLGDGVSIGDEVVLSRIEEVAENQFSISVD